ncbi:MAG: cysteine desulfurase family protein [Phycisphaerae bacterium]
MIYLDNNATTQMLPEVFDAMVPYLREAYGNPSSIHPLGQRARQAVEEARYRIATLLGAKVSEIVFTSGGTEADNAAILGTLLARPEKKTVVTSTVEHSAVRETLHALGRRGIRVVEIPVDRGGQLNLDRFAEAISDDDVALVSIMWANNETGVIFDIPHIAAMCDANRVPLHVDAVQAAGKIPVNLSETPIDLLSISGHKFHGPKGVGALYVRRQARWMQVITGGPQERDRRGGTENVAGIVGMGKAAELAQKRLESPSTTQYVKGLRDSLERKLLGSIPGTHVNGDPHHRLANTSNIGFTALEAEAILLLLAQHDICASAGAACSSGSLEPSPILRAMGLPDRIAHGSVRFSFSSLNTLEEVDQVADKLSDIIASLRETLPVV